MTPNQLLTEASALQEGLVSTRHTLHRMPGTGFDLSDTLAFAAETDAMVKLAEMLK